jgi:hypothetical protein
MNDASGAWGGGWGASWWRETEPVASLDFGLAATFADLDGALRLLHDRYVATGAMPPEASGRRVNVHNVLPSTKVFVARAGSRVVATLTMVEDSRLGLPMDEAFGGELGRLRERGRRIAEAAALTIDPAYRAAGVPIIVRLFRLVMLCATEIAGLDDVCFVVHPRYGGFYGRLFPFRRLPGTRTYRRMARRPVIGLRMDLHLVRALIRTERAGLSAGPQTRFMAGPEARRAVMAHLGKALPRSRGSLWGWARFFASAAATASCQPDPSSLLTAAIVGAMTSGAVASGRSWRPEGGPGDRGGTGR